ncbi:MAG: ABC transporter permease [Actinobacteria bacterium 69-20]|jgi:ABC-2 type transport system permease protein|nr:ABC transporter permease [Actinomycetota bacterium]OJV29476.1 MAG: ABC transporter permease [Actinobacteria bacterium 69-20]
MNPTYFALELKRFFRDYTGVFFIAVLPCFFYVVFGAAQFWSSQSVGRGNVAMYVMISMAAYGAVTATVSIGGSAAMERMQGWGRQLGLTPMRDSMFVATKAVVGVTVALVPIGLIFVIAAFTGARGDLPAWIVGGLVILVGAAVFSVYGLIFGLLFRSESAIGAASGTLVVLAFLGNLFFPLSGTLLTIAKFTPLYGYVSLARRTLTEGYILNGTQNGNLVFEPLWQPILNIVVWTVIFCALAVAAVRYGRRRQ